MKTRSDHVAPGTWDLPMLDMQVPGRVIGHHLVRKTLCSLRCFQNAMPRELPKGTMQQTSMDPFKKKKKKKTFQSLITCSKGVGIVDGRRHKGS